MIQLLGAAAEASPGQTAVVTPEGSVSYGALVEDARRVAGSLEQRGLTRFAVLEPDAAWVMRILAGAALAGAEPCQYQPDLAAADFTQKASALGHATVVTRREDLGPEFEVIRPEDLLRADPVEASPAGAQPLLILTSGTTGLPKAARHDWRVLGKTVERVRPAPEQRWLLAYGPQQFAGIQVLLHVAASQATLLAPFPRQPRDGLAALLTGEVNCVSATPTFWRFMLAEAKSRKAQLPPLHQITLGGEACPANLLDEIKARFPDARVSQVYASTELGSVTSVRDGRPGIAVDALYSESNPNSNLKVQDGELWVRPETGMLGYADETDQDPRSNDGSDQGWRRTGDLVEIAGDRVLFRGRTSEIINVGGVKVDPLPVEDRITALDGVAGARVFGRANALTGSIVAAEIVPVGGLADDDLEKLRLAVRDAVADLPRAWHPRSVMFVDVIELRGGKTVRGTEE